MKVFFGKAASVALIAALTFIGMTLGLSGGYLTGSNLWSVESVSLAGLAVECAVAGLAARLQERALRG